MGQISTGMYQTACEASPHKTQIDMWINEGKSNAFISRELKKKGEDISDKSVGKYRKYREEYIQKELQKDPVYQGQISTANQMLVDKASMVKQVDVLQHLTDIIENNADLLRQAQEDEIKVKNVQDLRFVQMSMLDAIKLYGETILKAQRFAAVQDNPEILRPTTININVKSALKDVLKEVMGSGGNGYELIDRLRAGINGSVGGGIQGNISGSRSGNVDGIEEDTEGETILVSEP